METRESEEMIDADTDCVDEVDGVDEVSPVELPTRVAELRSEALDTDDDDPLEVGEEFAEDEGEVVGVNVAVDVELGEPVADAVADPVDDDVPELDAVDVAVDVTVAVFAVDGVEVGVVVKHVVADRVAYAVALAEPVEDDVAVEEVVELEEPVEDDVVDPDCVDVLVLDAVDDAVDADDVVDVIEEVAVAVVVRHVDADRELTTEMLAEPVDDGDTIEVLDELDDLVEETVVETVDVIVLVVETVGVTRTETVTDADVIVVLDTDPEPVDDDVADAELVELAVLLDVAVAEPDGVIVPEPVAFDVLVEVAVNVLVNDTVGEAVVAPLADAQAVARTLFVGESETIAVLEKNAEIDVVPLDDGETDADFDVDKEPLGEEDVECDTVFTGVALSDMAAVSVRWPLRLAAADIDTFADAVISSPVDEATGDDESEEKGLTLVSDENEALALERADRVDAGDGLVDTEDDAEAEFEVNAVVVTLAVVVGKTDAEDRKLLVENAELEDDTHADALGVDIAERESLAEELTETEIDGKTETVEHADALAVVFDDSVSALVSVA